MDNNLLGNVRFLAYGNKLRSAGSFGKAEPADRVAPHITFSSDNMIFTSYYPFSLYHHNGLDIGGLY